MKLAIPLSEIPDTGIEKIIDNQSLWLEPIEEFKLSCKISEPVSAELFLMNQGEGCLVRGRMTGKVTIPCDRCGEEAEYPISVKFEEFEVLPQAYEIEEGDDSEDELPETSLIFLDNYSRPHVDLGSLLWEEFSLALPIKPLCKDDCKGICLVCGNNHNVSACSCDDDKVDPRFEKLKNLKIVK